MTKSLFTILIFSFLVVGISCDEDPATVNPQVSCQADYKNQNLQGKINGVPWEFKGGIANIDTLTDGYNHKYLANDSAISSFPCAFVVFQSHIAFGVTNSDKGYYQLGERKALDPLNSDGTAAIGFVWYDASNNPTLVEATCGYYEILSIDTINDIITGRMDVRKNDNFYANGNFTIAICDL